MKNKEAKELWFDHKVFERSGDLADEIWELMSKEKRKEELEQIKKIYKE